MDERARRLKSELKKAQERYKASSEEVELSILNSSTVVRVVYQVIQLRTFIYFL